MLFHCILRTHFQCSYESSLRLTSGFGNVCSSRKLFCWMKTGLTVDIIYSITCVMRHGDQSKRWEGDLNSMANWLMRHLSRYCFNLYAGFDDFKRWTSLKFGMICVTKIALYLWWNINSMTKVQSTSLNITSLNRTFSYCHRFSRNRATPFKAIERFFAYYHKL